MTVDVLSHSLLDSEGDLRNTEFALRVVNFNVTFSLFKRSEDVLVELGLEGGETLRAAAPGLDLRGLSDLDVLLERDGLLAHGDDLLVIHLVLIFFAIELCLDVVLDLGLGLHSVLGVLVEQTGGSLIWDNEGEVELIIARLNDAILVIELLDLVLEGEELVGLLEVLVALNKTGIFTLTFGLPPEASERVLASTLDLELEGLGIFDRLRDTKGDGAVDGVSWLVEGELSLDLD